MEMEIINKIAKTLSNPSFQAGVTSWLGWFAHYLYIVSKWEKFKWTMLVINIFLAFWLWTVVYAFVPDSAVKGWIMGVLGFSTYPILSIMEKKGLEIFEKYLHTK